MYPFLKTLHFLSLSLLIAAPAFLWLIWTPAVRRASLGDGGLMIRVQRPLRLAVVAAGLLFASSGLLDAFRALTQIFPLDDFELVRLFFTSTGFGRLTVVKLILIPVYLIAFWLQGGKLRWVARPVVAAAGLALVYTVSAASHAAGKEGFLPVASDMVHLLASSAWGGGLFYLAAFAPRRGEVRSTYRLLFHMIERFSNMALLAVAAVVATGAFATYLHVFDLNAMSATRYGRSLALKLALFVAVVGVAGYNLMVLGPALRRKLERGDLAGLKGVAARLATMVRVEAVIVIGIIVAVGVVTTLPPADKPGTVVAGVYEATAPGLRTRVDLRPLNEPGQLAIAVDVQTEDGVPYAAGTRLVIELDMLTHRMGVAPIEAQEVQPGRFEANALLPMAGRWEMALRVTPPAGAPVETSLQFDAATGSMLSGRVRRFDLSMATLSPIRQFTFGLGLLLIVLGAYGVVEGRRGRMVLAIIPLSLAMLAVGGYQVLTVTLTDSLPTTFTPNPVPYTLEAINRGAAIYAQYCAQCHGVEGRGDGILADSLNPRPANLTEEHVDDHTDGDIFWWITHGIDQTAMPPFGNVLTEEERWTVIHFVRSLRHFVPALDLEEQDREQPQRREVRL